MGLTLANLFYYMTARAVDASLILCSSWVRIVRDELGDESMMGGRNPGVAAGGQYTAGHLTRDFFFRPYKFPTGAGY